jgi:hypothetical protein
MDRTHHEALKAGTRLLMRALWAAGMSGIQIHTTQEDDYAHVCLTLPQTGVSYSVYVHVEIREQEVKSIVGPKVYHREMWVVTVPITVMGTHWEPDTEDELEIASGPSAEAALIDGVLECISRNMYGALPDPNVNLDPTLEDVPQ